MLRSLGVRSKLLALVAVPMAFLFVITGVLVLGEFRVAQRAGKVRTLTDVAAATDEVVHRLQIERSTSLAWLADPTSANLNQMRGQRQLVDTRVQTLSDLVKRSDLSTFSAQVRDAIATATASHAGLPGVRHGIDAHQYGVRDTQQYYGQIIGVDLQLPALVAQDAGDETLATKVRAYQFLSTAIEQESAERDMLAVALTRGDLSLSDYQVYSGLVAGQTQNLKSFRQLADPSSNRALTKILASADPSTIERFRGMAADLIGGKVPGSEVTAYEWVQAINSEVLPLAQLELRVVSDISVTASNIETAQRSTALLLVGLLALGLGLAILMTIVLARRITRPLRGLTTAVTGIGEELPRMVERMQTPGEGPGVEFEAIPVESRDEIGRLAEAFNSVNEVTVRVAKEQAALRASIAEMFVNVARRNQVLLGRQLHVIDSMESREEDAAVLENLFRLDHLATRMRRNAESLLVLAGIDATRRLRTSLPLSDVIRTAVSEIESYERVDLSIMADPDVSGRFALTVAHLLAELLENATHFSNPDTRVVVATTAHQSGIDVVVTDYGLGMTDDELADANDRIANPPVAEIAVAQRLGFFVVGRLAQRLGASATVDRGRAAGTVVTLTLPNSVFVGMAVETPAEDPADAPVDARTGAPEAVAEAAPAEAVAPASQPAALDPAVVEEVLDQISSEEPDPEPVAADEVPAKVRSRRLLPFRGRRKDTEPVPGPDGEAVPVERVDLEVRTDLTEGEPEAVTEPVAEVIPELEPAAGVEPVAEVEPERETEPEVEVEVEAEPEPVAEVIPQPASVPVPVAHAEPEPEQPVAHAEPEPEQPVAHAEPEPEPVAQAEPEPEPEPLPRFAYQPAVDILPGRSLAPARRGLRRRHVEPTRAPVPTAPVEPEPVPEPGLHTAAVVPAPVSEPAPVPAAVPMPVPLAAETSAPAAAELPIPPVVPAVPALAPRVVPVTVGAVAAPATAEPMSPAPVMPARRSTAPVPLPNRSAEMERVAADAQMHTDALSELRGLYAPTYAPPVVDASPQETPALVRRTPKAADEAAPAAAPAVPARQRTAAEVRGMLSGFRSGVERGRTEPAPTAPPVEADTESPESN